MKELQVFNFESNEVRTQIVDGTLWFIGKDVSDILGYDQTSNMMKRIDKEDSISSKMEGMNMKSILINESGLYSAVIGSKLPSAKKFKRWVTSEVLPSIRKTGVYQPEMSQEDIMIATLENQKEIKSRLNTVSEDVEGLKKEIDLNRVQKAKLSKLVKCNVMDAVGGKKSNAYKELYRVAIAEHWREIKNYFEVASYEEIPKVRFDEAIEVAGMWRPSMQLAIDIKRFNAQIEMVV
ncbi:MAG: ORF6C domain-containing protein [Carnobacterium sp.]|uniref:ORF6C domain-containing protein n=1 Tax=Carnobacterium sp. TaxID=48221 RepID=UPI003C719249